MLRSSTNQTKVLNQHLVLMKWQRKQRKVSALFLFEISPNLLLFSKNQQRWYFQNTTNNFSRRVSVPSCFSSVEKRGLTYESFTIHKHLAFAFDITPCGSNFALALDDDPTQYESRKLTKGKLVFAFEPSVDRSEGRQGIFARFLLPCDKYSAVVNKNRFVVGHHTSNLCIFHYIVPNSATQRVP